MVAVRSFFVLSLLAGIGAAGKCRPESSTITASETSLTSTTETLGGSTTETASDATSSTATDTLTVSTTETTTASTTESGTDTTLTTLTTSFASTETTTEPSTTTSAAPVVVTCPATTNQCVNTIEVMCATIIVGVAYDSDLNVNDCVHKCNQIPSCTHFVVWQDYNYCYLGYGDHDPRNEGYEQGWASGAKGRCAS